MPFRHRQTSTSTVRRESPAAARRRRLRNRRDRDAREARLEQALRAQEVARRRRRDRRLIIVELIGTAMAALIATALFTSIPADRAAERAYRAAPECADADAAAAPEPETRVSYIPVAPPDLGDCVHRALFRTHNIHIDNHGKDTRLSADLIDTTGTTGWGGRVNFHDEGPVLRKLHDGDLVIARVWRDQIVSVASDDNLTQQTNSDPDGDVGTDITAGALSSAVTLATLLDALRRFRRTRRSVNRQAIATKPHPSLR